MATPPRSPPHSDIPSKATSRRTRQSTWLRRLTIGSLDQQRPMVNVNPASGRGSGPHKEKFHSYLEVVAREKIPIAHSNWNVVPESLKNLIWDDILDFHYNYLTNVFFGFKTHWQLVVLCPRDNIVVWFCSLRKKPDVNIKAAINIAMKTLTTTLEGKPDQVVPR
ncbi:hypothetical protein JHK87_022212 [Glycine soja]|nr:hypothetical protein JHK87_022212 [Glycine soja]